MRKKKSEECQKCRFGVCWASLTIPLHPSPSIGSRVQYQMICTLLALGRCNSSTNSKDEAVFPTCQGNQIQGLLWLGLQMHVNMAIKLRIVCRVASYEEPGSTLGAPYEHPITYHERKCRRTDLLPEWQIEFASIHAKSSHMRPIQIQFASVSNLTVHSISNCNPCQFAPANSRCPQNVGITRFSTPLSATASLSRKDLSDVEDSVEERCCRRPLCCASR